MNPIYHIQTTPAACPENIVTGEHYRITVLTQGLLRLEYSPDGVFEDRPTQTVLHRDFPKTNFRVLHQDGQLEIHTDRVHLVYNEKPFSPQGLSIQVKGGLTQYHSIWRYGQKASDLGGTARTLDEANGAIPLESGILSRNGFAVLDDSSSQILLEDGWLGPRKRASRTCTSGAMDTTIPRLFRTFTICAALPPCCPALLLATGGAATTAILRTAIWS